jgi:hypothetical protein
MRNSIPSVESLLHVGKMDGIDMTREMLSFRYPGIEPDLDDVGKWPWLNGSLSYKFTTEPMSKFSEIASDLLACQVKPTGFVLAREEQWRKKDVARTNKIIKTLRAGSPQWPIFLDDENSILEGRHRLVAFFALNLTEVPVVYVCKQNE